MLIRGDLDESAGGVFVQHAGDQRLVGHTLLQSSRLEVMEIGRRQTDIDAAVLRAGRSRRLTQSSTHLWCAHRFQLTSVISVQDVLLDVIYSAHGACPFISSPDRRWSRVALQPGMIAFRNK